MGCEGRATAALPALVVAVLCAASPADAGEPDEAELPGLFAAIGSADTETAEKAVERLNLVRSG
ncbi:MAG: hypothetical protein ACYTKD_28260 [Planctomycetota bacterium]|jgi:hypothetical protein